MIKFFRRIRERLLVEKKFSQYLIYAIGEIILVVIGILIALAISNMNQDRIDDKIEQTYLLGLKEEFQISKLKLSELISVNEGNYKGATRILEYINNRNESPGEIQFSTLLYSTFSSDIAFNPNNSILNEMINSGSLKNISNTTLRIGLTSWISTLEDISRQENELRTQREKVLDMFRTNENSLRTILNQSGVYDDLGLPEADDLMSNLDLLNSVEFENNILMFMLTSYATKKAHYDPLLKNLDTILNLIALELKE